jgi:hypothetical protein
MKKKLGLTLTMVLLTVAGAHSSALSPTASGASKAGRVCPDLPPDCCIIKRVGPCPACALECG